MPARRALKNSVMECTHFSDRLDALLDGTLPAAERTRAEAHTAACPRCRELYLLMRVDITDVADVVDIASPETPGDLTESILLRTSGRACGRAQTLLGDHVDNTLAAGDRVLVDAHLQWCRECAVLAGVLTHLGEDLPVFAELRPDTALLEEVLARTVRPIPVSTMWNRAQETARRFFERPRIAWEAGYVAALVVWLVFGASWSPLRAAPVQALALIQQGATVSQAAGANAMAAINRRVAAINRRVAAMSERTIGAAVSGADRVTGGFFASLSDRYLQAAELAPDLDRHWRQLTAAVLDRDLFSGVDALRSLSRDAGSLLNRLLFSPATTTASGYPPERRSSS